MWKGGPFYFYRTRRFKLFLFFFFQLCFLLLLFFSSSSWRHISPISCKWFFMQVCLTKTTPLPPPPPPPNQRLKSSEASSPAFALISLIWDVFSLVHSDWLEPHSSTVADVAFLWKRRAFELDPLRYVSASLFIVTTWRCCLWRRTVVAWVSTTVYTHFNPPPLSLSLSKFFINLNEHIFPHISAFINGVFIQYEYIYRYLYSLLTACFFASFFSLLLSTFLWCHAPVFKSAVFGR